MDVRVGWSNWRKRKRGEGKVEEMDNTEKWWHGSIWISK